MKQRITPGQLQELTPSQQEKLREWWKPQEGDWVYNGNHEALLHDDADTDWIMFGGYSHVSKADSWKEAEQEIKSECLPLLSIGQCIEILQETAQKHWHEDLWMNGVNIPLKTGGWEWKWCCGHGDYNQFDSKELIDALFEAVKSIL